MASSATSATQFVSAFLVEFLGHPMSARDLEKLLLDNGLKADYRIKAMRLPPFNGHARQLPEWAKEMSEHLLGNKRLEHAVDPWLPDALT